MVTRSVTVAKKGWRESYYLGLIIKRGQIVYGSKVNGESSGRWRPRYVTKKASSAQGLDTRIAR